MNIPMLFAGWSACTPEELAIQDKVGVLVKMFIVGHVMFNVFLLWLVFTKIKRKTTKVLLSILIVLLAVIVGSVISVLLAASGPWCG